MPRAVKRSANQHNNRHENGVVAPGKRISKQRSNGYLNGPSSNGRSRTNTPPLPSPPTAQTIDQKFDDAVNEDSLTTRVHIDEGFHIVEEDKPLKEVTHDQLDEFGTAASKLEKAKDQQHRRMDIGSIKPPSAYESSGMQIAFTVLKSCPRSDTIAILIFLLSLPPTFLTLTNALFALLTFIPPSGTFLSVPTFTDIFQNNTLAVSFTTMCIIDLLGMFTWLLPTWAQGMILDWAQAMVASTLGGGYSNQPGGSDNTLIFMGVVSVAHLRHYRPFFLRLFNRTWMAKWVSLMVASSDTTAIPTGLPMSGKPLISSIESVIALHIVSQGVARLIRRWVKSYNDSGNSLPNGKFMDPEAVVGSLVGPEPLGLPDSAVQLNTPNELRNMTSLQSIRDGRDRTSGGKRKRKQGTIVRTQQPLWAAFAATKATIMREYEQTQATKDALGSNAIDSQNLGSAPFILEEGRAWITLVRPYSFFFETSYFSASKTSEYVTLNGADWIDDDGIDRSNPIYVRINGADWTSMKVQTIPRTNEDEQDGQQWTGEVYGLSPSSTYQVVFVRCEDEVVIYSENVVTPSSSSSDQVLSLASTQPAVRPSSPTSPSTTLKTSISALESSIMDVSSQQRRLRKDTKTTLTTIKRDLDIINDRVAKLGSNDRSLHSRQTQQTQHMRQADDALTNISSELEAYGNLPEDDSLGWRQAKFAFESERNDQSSSRQFLFRAKEASHRDNTNVQTEAFAVAQKQERLLQRAAKLSDQYGRLQSLTDQSTNGKERHSSVLGSKVIERTQVAAHYEEQIATLGRCCSEYRVRFSSACAQSQALEASFEQQSLMTSHSPITRSRPLTPEGDSPIVSLVSPSSFRYPHHGTVETSSQGTANGHLQNSRLETGRARSASILSGQNLYTDGWDQDFAGNMPGPSVKRMAGIVREGSSSSGGGSPGHRKGNEAVQ